MNMTGIFSHLFMWSPLHKYWCHSWHILLLMHVQVNVVQRSNSNSHENPCRKERDLLFHFCLNINHPINIIVLSEKQEGKGICILTSCAFGKPWQIWSHHFSMHRVLHSPQTSWLNLAVLNPTAPCCIMANLYLSPPPGELTFPEGGAPSAHRQACHAPIGAHHATDSSWQAVMAANKEPPV